ncbi:MAG: hypothetical protein WD269_04145 [Acidimicrobiia bacterium]
MARYAVAVTLVIGLAIGVWWLWPRDDSASPSTTLLASRPTTFASASTSTPSDQATTVGSHVVETVEEAEEVLRELWFGWFEGIYNQDEDRIREVVATEEQLQTARDQFGVMEFVSPPRREGLVFSETEILRSDGDCLAVWGVTNAEAFLGSQAARSGVDVLRWRSGEWIFAAWWVYREDLWENDCKALLSPPLS